MSQRHDRAYEFPDLPVGAIDPGTTVLVAGPSMGNARTLALRLLSAGERPEEGSLVITTNKSGEKLLRDCERTWGALDSSRLGIVDCVGDHQRRDGVSNCVETVSSPSDLTGIGIEFSGLYQDLHRKGVGRVRAGLDSVSTLSMYTDLRTMSRFIHTVGGRISATDGLGVFFTDPTTQDDRVVNTITQLCDGRIDVRERDGTSELRIRGLSDQSTKWVAL